MKHKIILLALTGFLAAFVSGCAALAVGAAAGAGAVGTYAYVNGVLKTSEATSFEKASAAAEAGPKELGYTVVEREKDGLHSKLVFRGAGDEKVTVTVKKLSETVSEIGVRVGTFGDKAKSTQILDKIKSKL